MLSRPVRDYLARLTRTMRIFGATPFSTSSFSVTSNPTAEWIVGHVTDAFPWDEAPRHLIRDRDGAFGPASRSAKRTCALS